MGEEVEKIIKAIPLFLDLPSKFQVDYDKDADVLYISIERPQEATDTEVTDEGILLRLRDDKLVGITILNASKYKAKAQAY